MTPQEQMNDKGKPAETINEAPEEEKAAYKTPDNYHDTSYQSFENPASQRSLEEESTGGGQGQETLMLSIKPDDLPSGCISIRELTHIAGGLQDLTDSIANTIYNQPSEKGKIPEDILENTKMVVNTLEPDTFQAVLTINHPQQTSLEEPDIVATLQALFRLFELSCDKDHLADNIAVLGPRTFRIYADWTKAIAELDTSVHMAWYSAYNDTHHAVFDPEKAAKIYQLLDDFSHSHEDIAVKGMFTGVNIRTGAFELITEEGEQISGTTSREAMADFAGLTFNQTYTVDLLKMRVTGLAINDKTAWTLKDMTPA